MPNHYNVGLMKRFQFHRGLKRINPGDTKARYQPTLIKSIKTQCGGNESHY